MSKLKCGAAVVANQALPAAVPLTCLPAVDLHSVTASTVAHGLCNCWQGLAAAARAGRQHLTALWLIVAFFVFCGQVLAAQVR